MRSAGISGVVLAAPLAAAGALTSVALAGQDGIPLNELAIALVILTYTSVAAVIVLARPGQLVGQLMFFGAVAWGVGEGALAIGVHDYVPGAETLTDAWLVTLGSAARGLGWLVLVLAVPMVFPDGRLAWPGKRVPTVIVTSGIVAFTAATLLSPTPLENRAPGMDSPTGLPERFEFVVSVLAVSALALAVVALAIALAGLVRRWRKGDEFQKQQLLWFSAAFATPLLFLPLIATPTAAPWMFAVVTVPVPVAVAVALFQRRLYDVQLVVSRTLTYLLLSAVVAGLYAVTVGGVGALLRERGAPWLAWVAAGVVAVTFAPLRNSLQQAVNRLTYGQWSQPADVLAATGRRLADASDVPGLLDTLTAELGTGLGLDYVEISDRDGRPLATHGSREGAEEATYDELPLMAYGGPVGVLCWSRKRLRGADQELLADVAHQLGGVVHAASLFDAIRDAQERLVLTREEERRRLRRDLHDGLGPALAGLTLTVDTLRNQVGRPDLDLDTALLRLRAGIQSTVVDVRRIVEGLRPPALDELGLEAAIEQLVTRLSSGSALVVDVEVPALPVLPAAVEVAIYRVTQEALTNVMHHSGASRASVTIDVRDKAITLQVSDNGSGQVAARAGGVGLASMRERAQEISGTLQLHAVPGRETTVAVSFPLTEVSVREREAAT